MKHANRYHIAFRTLLFLSLPSYLFALDRIEVPNEYKGGLNSEIFRFNSDFTTFIRTPEFIKQEEELEKIRKEEFAKARDLDAKEKEKAALMASENKKLLEAANASEKKEQIIKTKTSSTNGFKVTKKIRPR